MATNTLHTSVLPVVVDMGRYSVRAAILDELPWIVRDEETDEVMGRHADGGDANQQATDLQDQFGDVDV